MTRKTVFERWSQFKFNNLGLVLGTSLKFYTSVAKRLKLKVRKFLGLILTFVEVTGEKLVGRGGILPDNKSLNGVSNSLTAMSDCLLQVDVASIKPMIQSEPINLKWLEGSKPLGDCLTKKVAPPAHLLDEPGHFQN